MSKTTEEAKPDEVVIRVDHVSKYFAPNKGQRSIKQAVTSMFKKADMKVDKGYWALKDASFEVKKGEFFGIVGRNGSGKSTLLKMIAGIYSPTKGNISVKGVLVPFIELGVGFNVELSGRDNVFLNGALLGFDRKEMSSMYDEIVAFAELGEHMGVKLKNFSSGMQVRLAFSIAIRAQCDILLIDEVLAVGDAAFQQKCFDVFADLKAQGRTIVLVTHDMGVVLRFCSRAILIDDGKVLMSGEPKEVADRYLELNYDGTTGVENVESKQKTNSSSPRITEVEVTKSGTSKRQESFEGGENALVTIHYMNPKKRPMHFGLQIFSGSGVYCFGTNTKISGLGSTVIAKGIVSIEVNLNLVPGNYSITCAVMNESATSVSDYRTNAAKFRIARTSELEGVANLSHSWKEPRGV